MKCPKCEEPLSPAEIKTLWAQLTSGLRKTMGAGSGRPTKLRSCPGCRKFLGVVEMRQHRCPGKAVRRGPRVGRS